MPDFVLITVAFLAYLFGLYIAGYAIGWLIGVWKAFVEPREDE